MNTISIIGSGTDFNLEKTIFILEKSDYIIASDGGLNLLDRLNKKPDFILGDFDSVKKEVLSKYKEIPQEIYNIEKDLTDSELALKKAISMKPSHIYLINVTGDYFDHSLANIYNLVRNYNKDIKINIITANSTIFLLKENYEFLNMSGRRVSFFPLSKTRFSMEGFKYTFEKDTIELNEYSVSNVIEGNNAKININYGILVCILFDPEYK